MPRVWGRARLPALTRHAAARHCDIQPATATLELSSVVCDGLAWLDSMRCRGRQPDSQDKTPEAHGFPARQRSHGCSARQPGRFVQRSQRSPTRQTEIPHSHSMDSKAKRVSQSTAKSKWKTHDDRSQSRPWWLKSNLSLSAASRAKWPASCCQCHGLALLPRSQW